MYVCNVLECVRRAPKRFHRIQREVMRVMRDIKVSRVIIALSPFTGDLAANVNTQDEEENEEKNEEKNKEEEEDELFSLSLFLSLFFSLSLSLSLSLSPSFSLSFFLSLHSTR